MVYFLHYWNSVPEVSLTAVLNAILISHHSLPGGTQPGNTASRENELIDGRLFVKPQLFKIVEMSQEEKYPKQEPHSSSPGSYSEEETLGS